MKLSEIKETNNPMFAWITKNVKSLKMQNLMLDYIQDIKPEDQLKQVSIQNLTLTGNGEPFEPPPFDLHVANELILNNYDFENSDYGKPGTIQGAHIILEYGPKCDLVKVVQKIVNMQCVTLGVIVESDGFTNLIPATDISWRLNLSIVDWATQKKIIEIRTESKKIFINGEQLEYSDVFDLQDILIQNGFKEYV
ncbi:hypothetical protein RsoM2USA_304 [Ralstonia phage RsoM2USA]|nr:hypothetical protein RsoM2USA_304 [Ralstonia phage RsoM2USA]